MSGKNKGGGVRERVKGLMSKADDEGQDANGNGAESNRLKLLDAEDADAKEAALAKHVAEAKAKEAFAAAPKAAMPQDGRTPANLADYYAASLHTANQKILDLRKQVFEQQQQLVERDTAMLKKDQTIYHLEERLLVTENAKLRKKHSLVHGQTIVSDDETGEVYRATIPQAQ